MAEDDISGIKEEDSFVSSMLKWAYYFSFLLTAGELSDILFGSDPDAHLSTPNVVSQG